MSLISVVIPSYNRASLIAQTIKSVQNQSYTNWELLIVDDGSTDNTFNVIEPYLKDDRITLHYRPKDRPAGGNAARNYGFELSKGEYIKWLDSDDLLDSECLKFQAEMINRKNADVVFCRSKLFTSDKRDKITLGEFWHPFFPDDNESHEKIFQDFILGKYRFSNNDGLWKKSFFNLPPYNETLKNSQEWLMITESLCERPDVRFLKDVLVYIRAHAEQMQSKRTYGSFANNQCRARYLAIKKLKIKKMGNNKIFIFLLKSQVYYQFEQIRKGSVRYFFQNLLFLLKSTTQIIFK